MVHIKCDAPGDRGKLLNQLGHVNGKNKVTAKHVHPHPQSCFMVKA
jgi:hypothetical protein